MSNNQLNHSYDTNQKDSNNRYQESKQAPYITSHRQPKTMKDTSSSYSSPNPKTIEPLQPHSADKIQLRSSRGNNHTVNADNFRIRYYMNLNLVKHANNIQYRSSSLPREQQNAYTPPSKMPSHTSYPYTEDNNLYHNNKTRESRQNSLENIIKNDLNDDILNDDDIIINNHKLKLHDHHSHNSNVNLTHKRKHRQHHNDNHDHDHDHDHSDQHEHHKKCATKRRKKRRHKTIHIVSKAKSGNNTPPRPIASMLKRSSHHKRLKIGLSRLRSRSDGMLSFKANKSVDSIDGDDNDNDNDADSVSTADSVNNINNASSISNSNTPSNINKFIISTDSQTPPGSRPRIKIKQHGLERHNSYDRSLMHQSMISKKPKHSSSISIINRSKPMSIASNRIKSRFDVDFKPHYQPSSDLYDNDLTNHANLFDDEANFEME